jgi:predicted transcriptional regulator
MSGPATREKPAVAERPRSIKLTDPRALRAVAHPLRLELIGLLRRSGPLTATQAAEQVGESPANCSFHLRQLAKYGLVEEAGGGRGRERPWQATATYTEWPAALGDDEEQSAASEMLSRVSIERYFEETTRWLGNRRSEPREWLQAADTSDNILYLTPAELEELLERVNELMEPYYRRLSDPAERPEGARPVSLVRFAFPLAEQPGEK